MKITIGMACYNDFNGVYFTIQAIRMYNKDLLKDIEFIIIDNNPDDAEGQHVQQFANWIRVAGKTHYKYITNKEWNSTACRQIIFEQASAPIVLCIDCHILIAPGAIEELLQYYDANPNCKDLLHGPILNDNLTLLATHMEPIWDYNMYGKWSKSKQNLIKKGKPFEIPMTGMGLFSCKKDAWPGFNRLFRGFGGEEGYIHEKFRQAGGKALCLPFLQWTHRFQRPQGIPYRCEYIDRVRNYIIGWLELKKDTKEIFDYFSKANELDGQDRKAIPIKTLQLMEERCKLEMQMHEIDEEIKTNA